MVITKT